MASTTELTTGLHLFKITGYSLLQEVEVGKYISSTTFAVAGHEFYIDLYPQGNEESNEEYISIYLVLASDDKQLPVHFDFALVDMSDDNSVVLGEKVSHSCTFAFKNQYWGFGRFIKRAELEASQFLKDDCLLVKCTVRVVKATSGEPDTRHTVYQSATPLPPPDLHLHLANLLESTEMADVTFQVDGQNFSAHRLLLAARSPVFKQLLTQTSEGGIVKIENMKAPVFKALLRYVYTEELPEASECMAEVGVEFDQEMLNAADAYAIERLKLICEQILCDKLSLDTVASSFELAEKHKCDRLKDACLEFAAKPANLIALMQTDAKSSELELQHQNSPGLADLLRKLSEASISK